MRKYLTLLFMMCFAAAKGQSFSTYYGTYSVNVTGDIKTESTIHNIDYAALARANAVEEANRLKRKQYNDARAKQIGVSIANNPINAYTYGYPRLHMTLRDWAKNRGIKPKYGVFFIAPNTAIFDSQKYNVFRNVSSSGVTTEFSIELPYEWLYMATVPKVKELYSEEELDYFKLREENPREASLPSWMKEGVSYTWGFLHSKELYTANVYGSDGFRGTLKIEDEFNIIIEDTYVAALNGGLYGSVKIIVQYKADKRMSTFENLEGRRYYLQPLIEKTISTARYPTTKGDMRRMGIYQY